MVEQLISKVEESLTAYAKELNGSLEKKNNNEYVLRDKTDRAIAVVNLRLNIVHDPYWVFHETTLVGKEIHRRLKSIFKEIPIYATFMQ